MKTALNAHISLDFSRRWTGVEVMDDPACDTRRLLRTVAQFRVINRLVSRYRSILTRYVLADMRRDPGRTYHLIDVGAGGCDIADWLLTQAERRGWRLRVTAIDSDRRTVRFARACYGRRPGLTIARADLADLPRFGPADFVFSNHVLHHLPDAAIPDALAAMDRAATRIWLVSDLRRSRAAYHAFGLLGPWFRDSFAYEDGRRSIRRGFIAQELQAHARAAGLLDRVTIERLCPGRLLLVGRSGTPGVGLQD